MSFLQKYACFYGNIEFTPEEQQEIGAFAAGLLKAASSGDEDGLVTLFANEFGNMDEETFDRVNRYVEFLDKTAEGAFQGANISNILAPLAIALAATPLLGHAFRAVSGSLSLKSALSKALEMHPELKSDPNIKDYFQAISSFAPDIAKNPLMVGNILSQMHRIGPSALTPQLLNDLIGMQSKIVPQTAEKAQPLAQKLMDAAKLYKGKRD